MSKPAVHSIDDLEAYASSHLPKLARDYFNGGSTDGVTLRANRDEYKKWYIQPRVLCDVTGVDTSAVAFDGGNAIPFPCCVAPAAMQRMAHPDGELATARGCGAFGTMMGLSTFSTTSLEDVKAAADEARLKAGFEGPSECVLQIYLFENRQTSLDLIRRAEDSGYRAIVLTADTPFFGRRLTEIRNGFRLPAHLRMANFDASLEVKTGSELRTDQLQGTGKGQATKQANKLDASLTWEALRYLKQHTRLPIWVKGIMSPQDATLAIENGADAIFSIVNTVAGRVPVHFDGGIRRGSDMFKAMCLGANIVWIGRPALWAIAYDGEKGMLNALTILRDEFRECMALAGCTSLKDLGPHLLIRADSRM
uniref:FMN hydroxy acid dehydrogenase domain-containing protein n=1 Tax=Bionectria ochroleuca TaxID=29856 RepID=A0A8H7TMN2_BIOOC